MKRLDGMKKTPGIRPPQNCITFRAAYWLIFTKLVIPFVAEKPLQRFRSGLRIIEELLALQG